MTRNGKTPRTFERRLELVTQAQYSRRGEHLELSRYRILVEGVPAPWVRVKKGRGAVFAWPRKLPAGGTP